MNKNDLLEVGKWMDEDKGYEISTQEKHDEFVKNRNYTYTTAQPCPFCGMKNNLDIDTLYPSGIGWKEDDFGDGTLFRHYVSVHEEELPRERWCYKVICNENYGGCGAQVHGDSSEEAIEKWNRRV